MQLNTSAFFLLIAVAGLQACDSNGGTDGGGLDSAVASDAGAGADASTVDGGADAGGDDAGAPDAGMPSEDAGGGGDAGVGDAGTADAGGPDAGAPDAGFDAGPAPTPDAGAPMRTTIFPAFCPSASTSAGYYRGTLASNLNDVAGACGVTAPGRDGAVRVEVASGQTLRARYRHAGDGAIYLLDSCPVVASCLAGADASLSGEESLEWTNSGGASNPVYVILDSDSISGPQTFELDLELIGP